MKHLTLSLIYLLPLSVFAATTPSLLGSDAAGIDKPFVPSSEGYYFTLFQNAKINVQVTATTYSDETKTVPFGVVQCDAPVAPSPFGHTSAQYLSIDPTVSTTVFMLQDASGTPIEITKTGAGLFSICPDNDPNTQELITPDQARYYDRFCD